MAQKILVNFAFHRAVELPTHSHVRSWIVEAKPEWSIRQLKERAETVIAEENGFAHVSIALVLHAARDRALAFHESVESCIKHGDKLLAVGVVRGKRKAHDHHADHHCSEKEHTHEDGHHCHGGSEHGHHDHEKDGKDKHVRARRPSAADLDAAAAASKIPVMVLTGFLGSGKTTLLNHLLHEQRDKKIAVIENEFGEVPIDNELLSSKLSLAEQMVVLSSGCMCCTVRGDLLGALMQVHAKVLEGFPLDGVLIETTGMADPVPIVRTILQTPAILQHFRMDGVVTLVDCKNILSRLEEMDAKGAPDKGTVDEAFQQIMFADLIVMNKVDLVPSAVAVKVWQRVRDINSRAQVLSCVRGQLDPNDLVGAGEYLTSMAARHTLDDDDLMDEGNNAHNHHHEHEHSHEHGEHCDHEHEHGESCDHGHEEDSGCEGHCHDENCKEDHDHSHREKAHGHGNSSASRHSNQVGSFSLLRPGKEVGPLEFARWVRTLSALPAEAGTLYRCKAVLAVAGSNRKLVFHAVSDVVEKAELGEWEEGEARGCKIVFIGKKLDREYFTSGVDATLRPVRTPLRPNYTNKTLSPMVDQDINQKALTEDGLLRKEGAAAANGHPSAAAGLQAQSMSGLLPRIFAHSPAAFYRVLLFVSTSEAAKVGMVCGVMADAVFGTEAHAYYQAMVLSERKGHHPFSGRGMYLHALVTMPAAASYVIAFRESKVEICSMAGLSFSSAGEVEAAGVTYLEVCDLADDFTKCFVHDFSWRAETIRTFLADPESSTSSTMVKVEYEVQEEDDAFDDVTDVLKFRVVLQPDSAANTALAAQNAATATTNGNENPNGAEINANNEGPEAAIAAIDAAITGGMKQHRLMLHLVGGKASSQVYQLSFHSISPDYQVHVPVPDHRMPVFATREVFHQYHPLLAGLANNPRLRFLIRVKPDGSGPLGDMCGCC